MLVRGNKGSQLKRVTEDWITSKKTLNYQVKGNQKSGSIFNSNLDQELEYTQYMKAYI